MGKTDTTKELEQMLCRTFHRQYGCLEVSIGIGSRIRERVDFMAYDHTHDVFKCFEVKVSKADFRSSAAKSFVGNLNYYVMPFELYSQVKDEIPKGIGVLTPLGKHFESSKKAQRRNLSPEEYNALKDSLIRSLAREANKLYSSDDEVVVGQLKREVGHLTSQYNRLRDERNALRSRAHELEMEIEELGGAVRRR